MDTIERILRDLQQTVQYATRHGNRVHSGNAYKADPVDWLIGDETLVCIECQSKAAPAGVKLVVIDHHRRENPGWSMEPAQYWEASSIGQLHQFLNLTPTPGMRIIAAMDHCFSAALRGECPGADPYWVLEYKINSVAAIYHHTADEVKRAIEIYRFLLRTAPTLRIGSTAVADLRREDLGVGKTLNYACLKIAIAIQNQPTLFQRQLAEEKRMRVSLYGADFKTNVAFMETWAPANGIIKIYGVPEKGYVIGYPR